MAELTLKSEPLTIDGVEYKTQQFAAMRGYGMFMRLAKLLGPMLGALGGTSSLADLMATDMSALAPALGEALAKLDPAEAQRLAVDLLASTTAQLMGPKGPHLVPLGSTENIDAVFSGRLPAMMRVLLHALRVNYGNFFAGSAPAAVPPPAPNAG